MQKWCPEPFPEPEAGQLMATAPVGEEYAPAEIAGDGGGEDRARSFRSESGFNTPDSIMVQLNQQERAVVFELVEQDVAREYEQRELNLREELQGTHAEELTRLRDETQQWAEGFAAGQERSLREMAAASARLAVALAEKIVRAEIARDPEPLVRAIETALFATGAGEALQITVHPEDAAWLAERGDLRERLNIGEVVADRRIDRGGCRVACEGREWDATLAGQLDTLSDVVEEWIATANAPAPPEETDGPALG